MDLEERVMHLERQFRIFEAVIVAQQDQIRILQANQKPRDKQERKERVNPKIMQAIRENFRPVPEAIDITELTVKEITETLRANGLRLAGTPHSQSIAIARALVAFGAVPARGAQGRFYRGIVRKTPGTE